MLAIAGASPALAGAVTVSPLPGTPDASPATQISILGTPSSNIASVSVTGSLSGVHEGQLEPYSANQGASFVLNAPLTEGEEVTAVVALKEGAPISDSFSVAHLSEPSPFIVAPGEKPEDQEHFYSAPALRPPIIKLNKYTPGLEGDIFLDPLPAPIIHVGKKLLEFEPVGPNGPMILNPEGKLVWWDQLPKGNAASNMQVTTYEHKKVLAWWQGPVTEAAYGEGEGIIANSSYETIAKIKAGNGYTADIHELNITPSGDAYIVVVTSVCLPTCSESNPPVLDSVVQEVDIRTGLVVWEWHALGHVPITDTEVEPSNGVFDPYHMNSIQPLPENKVLISFRDTSSIYELDQETGSILWALGGKKNSFQLGKGVQFYFQHDVRLQGNKLTMFDNEVGPPIRGISRGLVLKLTMQHKRAVLAHAYVHGASLSTAEGSTQSLKHRDVMVGFGNAPYFTEFSSDGEVLLDAELPKGDGTYRVLRFPWSGTPKTLPAIAAVRESPSEVDVYASWNGATSVADWEVLAGPSPSSLVPVATAPWSSFETKIVAPSTESTFEVRALNAKGAVLATSAPVTAP